MNQQNLINLKDRTKEQRRYIASLGGKASAIKRNAYKIQDLNMRLYVKAFNSIKNPCYINHIDYENKMLQARDKMRKEYNEYIELCINNGLKNTIIENDDFRIETLKITEDLINILADYISEHQDNENAKDIKDYIETFKNEYLKRYEAYGGGKRI